MKTETTDSLKEHHEALYTLLEEFDRVCTKLEIPYVLFAGTLLGAVRHRGFIPWDDDLDILMLRRDYRRFLEEADACLDRERFFLQKEFSEHWPMFFSKLRLNNTTCLEKYHPRDEDSHQGIYIDLFPCDNAARWDWARRIQFLLAKVVIAKSLDARGYDTDSRLKKTFIRLCRLLPGRLCRKLAMAGREDSETVHCFFGGSSGYAHSVFPRKNVLPGARVRFEKGDFPIPEAYDPLLTQLYGAYMQLPSEEERSCKSHALLVDFRQSYEAYRGYRDGMTFDTYTRSIR